ncbi:MAG TPA: MBL fold metallo-hydrolase [Gemmataceae bacterium]|nr:MBL fold metallo-hydrolase [Gemmataceae bacterium]
MVAKFVFWDVQHGNACYIETPTGKRLVIDCGVGSYIKPADATFSPLGHLWHRGRVRNLDAAIITHPHRDHIEDIGNLTAFKPKKVVAPRHLSKADIDKGNRGEDRDVIERYLQCLRAFPQTLPYEQDPLNPTNSGLSILYYTPTKCATSNLNNHSIVTVVSYAGSKILIPGDNESPSWKELLELPHFVSAIKGTDILLAPHHGREAGYSVELFKHINPWLVIISDGSFSDTSATDRYSKQAKGLQVQRRTNGARLERKCVTTRNDDYIAVELGTNSQTRRRFIHVTID